MKKSLIKRIVSDLNNGKEFKLSVEQSDVIHAFMPNAKFDVKPCGNYKAIVKLKY